MLAAGAINSPQLLMLSGIGPAAALQKLGIEVLVNLPGVGQNLQDHLDISICHACTTAHDLPLPAYRPADD